MLYQNGNNKRGWNSASESIMTKQWPPPNLEHFAETTKVYALRRELELLGFPAMSDTSGDVSFFAIGLFLEMAETSDAVRKW